MQKYLNLFVALSFLVMTGACMTSEMCYNNVGCLGFRYRSTHPTSCKEIPSKKSRSDSIFWQFF